MTEELENKIKNKKYSELSAAEIRSFDALEIDEKTFNNLKVFYLQLNTNLEKIQVSKNVKDKLDTLFIATYDTKTFSWYKKVGAFIFPTDKALFARPIIQFVTATLLITAGITIFNTSQSIDRSLAQYQPKKLKLLKIEEVELESITAYQELTQKEEILDQYTEPKKEIESQDVKSVTQFQSDQNMLLEEDIFIVTEHRDKSKNQDSTITVPISTTNALHPDLISSEVYFNFEESLSKNIKVTPTVSVDNLVMLDLLTPLF